MILIYIQRLLAIASLIAGIIVTFSETPITEGIGSQMMLTLEGILLIAVSVGWLYLIGWEEEKYETR